MLVNACYSSHHGLIVPLCRSIVSIVCVMCYQDEVYIYQSPVLLKRINCERFTILHVFIRGLPKTITLIFDYYEHYSNQELNWLCKVILHKVVTCYSKKCRTFVILAVHCTPSITF